MAEKEKVKKPNVVGQFAGAATAWLGSWIGALFLILLFICFLYLLIWGLGCVINVFSNDANCSGSIVYNVVSFAGRLTQIGAFIFEFGLRRVVLVGSWLGPKGAFGAGISIVWGIVRDIVNLALIGGLIWASISMILRNGQAVGKLVVQIIIAALLVNFSYLFAGAVIDASNFATKVIFEEAFAIQLEFPPGLQAGQRTQTAGLISERFMTATRLSGLLYSTKDSEVFTDVGDYSTAFFLSFIAIFLLGTAAWIFMSMGGLFIQRFIVIVILLMTAPIGMLAFIDLPRMKEYGQGWWAALWSQAAFPPVMMIGIAASLKVLEEASRMVLTTEDNLGGDVSILSLFKDGGQGFVSLSGQGAYAATWDLILIYIIGIGLFFLSMRMSVNIAKQEPLKVPTTGQIYGAYRGVTKAAGQFGGNAAKFIGGIPIPGQSLYRNLGDFLTFGPNRRAISWPTYQGRLGDIQFAQNKADWERKYALANIAAAKRRQAEDDLKNGRNGVTLEDVDRLIDEENLAKDKAAVAQGALPDDLKRQIRAGAKLPEITEAEEKAKVTKEDRDDVAAAAALRSSEANLGAAQQRVAAAGRQASQVAAAPAGAPTPTANQRAVAVANKAQNQSVKDAVDTFRAAETKLELIDMAKEADATDRLISALRTNGKNGVSQVSALPGEVLVQPKIRVQVNGSELIEVGKRKDISDQEWETIAGGASDEARDHFEKNAPRGLKKKRPLPPKKVEVVAEPEGGNPPETPQT